MSDDMTIGEQIRRYRMAAGMTATDVASNVPMSRGYLSTIESGKRKHGQPSPRILARIADVLGVTTGDLLDTQPPPVRCKHWSIQWMDHPGRGIECMSCGKQWEIAQ